MRRIECGVQSHPMDSSTSTWPKLGLEDPWPCVLEVLSPGTSPRPAQVEALGRLRVLEGRRNLIVSAPTNGGKSLVGLLLLLEALRRGRRALLLEPLRALAREKFEELQEVRPQLEEALGRRLRFAISTGDYRQEGEVLGSPPPEVGELLIATPERVEALLRNPEHEHWLASFGAVCVDEAHLIGDQRRGPVLEFLVTSLLCQPAPPRLVLLSAALGNLGEAGAWLEPCDCVRVEGRWPPLRTEVLELDPEEKAEEAVLDLARGILADSQANLLLFVYQTRSAERLALLLQERLGGQVGREGALAYHSQMAPARREAARRAFREGRSRVVVTTSALALGVNLPATHVLIRDTTFPGFGRLELGDLLQMTGRAGRGDRPGHALVVVKPGDRWEAEELAGTLGCGDLPPLVSAFRTSVGSRAHDGPEVETAAGLVASLISRQQERGVTTGELEAFFQRSLGAASLSSQASPALDWLLDPGRVLGYRGEGGRFHLTVLGLKATRAALPLSVAAGYSQLLRDLLCLDPSDRLLERWTSLDHLIALGLLSDRSPRLRPFSESLAGQVDAWIEGSHSSVPLLYREWIRGAKGHSRASEVLGSLGLLTGEGKVVPEESARGTAYLATFRSLILWERGRGVASIDLERQWRVTDLAQIEERWRDDLLWLLSGLARLLELRVFYYHLRETCDADTERLHRAKRLLARMRHQIYDLLEHLRYCSPLGPALRSLRRSQRAAEIPSVGIRSLRRLEEAGYRSLHDLCNVSVSDLVGIGFRRDLAKQLLRFVRGRLQ